MILLNGPKEFYNKYWQHDVSIYGLGRRFFLVKRRNVRKRNQRKQLIVLAAVIALFSGACTNAGTQIQDSGTEQAALEAGASERTAKEMTQPVEASAGPEEAPAPDFQTDPSQATVTEGTQEYRGFLLDNVLHSANDGENTAGPGIWTSSKKPLPGS